MRAVLAERTVFIAETPITYQLEYKAVKNLNLRVRLDGTVYVSARRSVPVTEIDSFVVRNGARILAAKEKFAGTARCKMPEKSYVDGEVFYIQGRPLPLRVLQAERESVAVEGTSLLLQVREPENFERKRHLMRQFFDRECLRIFGEILEKQYPLFREYGVLMPQLRIRDMKSCWGSCLTKKGIITLNKRLLQAPTECIEYVVLHELCHLIHPDHSRRFYGLLETFMSDWKARKALLKQGAALWL